MPAVDAVAGGRGQHPANDVVVGLVDAGHHPVEYLVALDDGLEWVEVSAVDLVLVERIEVVLDFVGGEAAAYFVGGNERAGGLQQVFQVPSLCGTGAVERDEFVEHLGAGNLAVPDELVEAIMLIPATDSRERLRLWRRYSTESWKSGIPRSRGGLNHSGRSMSVASHLRRDEHDTDLARGARSVFGVAMIGVGGDGSHGVLLCRCSVVAPRVR
ncbi:hypothetical protein [Nocardia mangyaensis]|uniref:hypothetical protein n=1 Tax=Nocardia mangyaensis TaxID=2213200 RepID=UPI0026749511|nr:hypothetical protein [Nocardia mangyaensis]MDO3646140.1 hypothetical protein [Nocardia mangyaensis]